MWPVLLLLGGSFQKNETNSFVGMDKCQPTTNETDTATFLTSKYNQTAEIAKFLKNLSNESFFSMKKYC